MSRSPLILRLILPFAMMIIIVVAVCGVVVYWTGQRNVRLQQIRDLDRLTIMVRGILRGDETSITPEQALRMKDLADVLQTRITLIDPKGVVMLDTHHDPATMENHNQRPEVVEARQSNVGSSVRRSDTINENAVYVAQRLDPARPDGIIVRLSFPEHVWAKLSVPVWAIVLGATISSALLMVWLARSLQRQWIGPIRNLADAADKISAGDWHTRIQPDGAPAVEFLGSRFNVMAAQAQQQMDDLLHQRADLQSLVDSLPDPILLSDSADRITVINSPAARLLQLTPVQALGKKITVVVNEEAILRVLEDAKRGATTVRELRLQRNGQRVTYQAVATSAKAGGVLLVLRNISALAATLQMKTDFVANASHELRTPVAAIKAAFETLQDVYTDDPVQTARCVTIMAGQLHRIEEMLSDLLDLSRIESPELSAQLAPVQIPDLVSFVRQTMGNAAHDKGVELEFDTSDWGDPEPILSDRHLLELVLRNLVENSIKFTPDGGRVTTSFSRGGGLSILQVTDTGIGIPPEHQQRVFERFYQVDAARSGSAGRGTGLGLAIVKHAVHALGGTVNLSSAVGVGTKIRCILPEIPTPQDSALPPNDSADAGPVFSAES